MWLLAPLAPFLSATKMEVLDAEAAQANLDSFFQVENVFPARLLSLLRLQPPPSTLLAQDLPLLLAVDQEAAQEVPVPQLSNPQ